MQAIHTWTTANWPTLVAVATVVGAVVGFVGHALTVRKTVLEIEKLGLEIAKIRREMEKEASLIQIATPEEVMRLGVKSDRYVFRGQSRDAAPPMFVVLIMLAAFGLLQPLMGIWHAVLVVFATCLGVGTGVTIIDLWGARRRRPAMAEIEAFHKEWRNWVSHLYYNPQDKQ